jgi:diaminohydroxyphosphoribosylaminopyrimidine deaminase/5-amino-6-(5-phosphoribosylamino)uracil reductase
MTRETFDGHMMAIALRLAKRGLGTAAPNPSVGAVIADPAAAEVIARGWTQPGGRPHAETEALRWAGRRARGATMYVTLEPCAHHGLTPPCAGAIAAAGIARTVIGIEDPDPRTAGAGAARLTAAGIEVVVGVSAEEARWLTLGHILRVSERRPFVQAKLALDAAGEVPRGTGARPRWATGVEARCLGHLLRAEADAILVGSRTVIDDDPELTCRLPGLRDRSPVAVVLSRTLDFSPEAKVIATARERPVWIFCAEDAPADRRAAFDTCGTELVAVPWDANGLDVSAVLEALAARGITRLLVEGGPTIWRAFADAGFVDEAVMFQGGPAGSDHSPARGPTPHAALKTFLPSPAMTLADTRRIGDDHVYFFRRA